MMFSVFLAMWSHFWSSDAVLRYLLRYRLTPIATVFCLCLWTPSKHLGQWIRNVSVRCRWVMNITPWPLYPREGRPWYPSDRRLGDPWSRSRRFEEQKKSIFHAKIRPRALGCPFCRLVTTRILWPCSWAVAFFEYRCSDCATVDWSSVLTGVSLRIFDVRLSSRSVYWVDIYI